MKVFLLILSLLALSTSAYAQLNEEVVAVAIPIQPKTASADMASLHTQTAVTQILEQVTLRLAYPEELEAARVEGMVMVRVVISEAGKIQSVTLAQGAHPLLSESVLRVMKTVKSIEFQGKRYLGANKLNVPFRFSFDQ